MILAKLGGRRRTVVSNVLMGTAMLLMGGSNVAARDASTIRIVFGVMLFAFAAWFFASALRSHRAGLSGK